ncbi:MAG: catechol 2,3-dioxygenase [Kiloniellaceae bacterium]
MALNGVLRPGFVQLRVKDIDEALIHYRDRIGLSLVSREADDRVYLKAYDEFDRHSIVLRETDSAGMDAMGWKVLDEAAMDAFARRIEALGVEVTDVEAGEQPGVGRRKSFVAPTGHRIDLYAEMQLSDDCPMTENPDVWRDEPRGMKAIRFDHCLLYGDDIDGALEVFTGALDFQLAECVKTEDGTLLAIFLTCSGKAHDVAFVRHEEKDRFHHCAFLLEDWSDIGHAADIITRYDIEIDIGPTRHGITRGKTVYFFDPSGNRNEVFAGGYQYYPDHPTRVWSVDQIGKSVFYYERALNDRFMTVVT